VLIISYDFENDKNRTKFSKFLERYGRRIQYSVFEIRNSERVLDNILEEIESRYKKTFSGADSIIIFQICGGCEKKVLRYGYAENDDKDFLVFS
jgi:CRISPR-associated protein Cas2